LREMTKIHEEVRAGALSELRHWTEDASPRGEIVLVIAAAPGTAASDNDAEAVVRTLRESGLSASQAAREAASITGLPRSELYKLAAAMEAPASIRLKGQLALPDQDALEDPLGDQKGPE
jgi:16S rRNA (cytidine1402-2'-O)-methyltransferase